MLQADLADTGIPYVVDGLYFDFHLLRHQTMSSGGKWGPPQGSSENNATRCTCQTGTSLLEITFISLKYMRL
jgi:hypothetical protein